MASKYFTIPGFSKLSRQTIFDMAVAHIAKTRKPSINNITCIYGGSGCNAAPLLRPEYRDAADNVGAWPKMVMRNKVPKVKVDFIAQLQDAHDGCSRDGDFMAEWKHRMRSFAIQYKLKIDNLDKVTI